MRRVLYQNVCIAKLKTRWTALVFLRLNWIISREMKNFSNPGLASSGLDEPGPVQQGSDGRARQAEGVTLKILLSPFIQLTAWQTVTYPTTRGALLAKFSLCRRPCRFLPGTRAVKNRTKTPIPRVQCPVWTKGTRMCTRCPPGVCAGTATPASACWSTLWPSGWGARDQAVMHRAHEIMRVTRERHTFFYCPVIQFEL